MPLPRGWVTSKGNPPKTQMTNLIQLQPNLLCLKPCTDTVYGLLQLLRWWNFWHCNSLICPPLPRIPIPLHNTISSSSTSLAFSLRFQLLLLILFPQSQTPPSNHPWDFDKSKSKKVDHGAWTAAEGNAIGYKRCGAWSTIPARALDPISAINFINGVPALPFGSVPWVHVGPNIFTWNSRWVILHLICSPYPPSVLDPAKIW